MRLGGNHIQMRARPAGAGARSSGSGSGLGLGSVILPGLVLFEPGLTGTMLQRIAPAPLSGTAPRLKGNRTRTIAMVCAVPVWNDPLQWFRPNRCNRSDSKLRLCPSRSAINSAPFFHFKNTAAERIFLSSSVTRVLNTL